jgi:sugar phosphate permease
VLYGAIGIIWAVIFYRWYRDNPRDHPSVNEAELALLAGNENLASGHGDVPWAKLLRSRTVWLLWAQYFLITYPWYFYITWLPTFLKERYPELSDTERGNLAIFPLFFGGIGSLICAWVTPHIVKATGSVKTTRRFMGTLGFLGAAVMLFVFTQLQAPDRPSTLAMATLTMFCMGLTSLFNDLTMPGSWAACMDVGGKYAGTMSGSMNMMGNLAGFVAPWAGGRIVDAGLGWSTFLLTMSFSYLLGALCWPFIDPVTPIENDEKPPR